MLIDYFAGHNLYVVKDSLDFDEACAFRNGSNMKITWLDMRFRHTVAEGRMIPVVRSSPRSAHLQDRIDLTSIDS